MEPPKIDRVEIASVRPEAADMRKLAHLSRASNSAVEPVLYLVKLYLSQPVPATSSGFVLYVGEERIPKYTAFAGGIYFNVHDPAFLEKHRGQPVHFAAEVQELEDVAKPSDEAISLPGIAEPAQLDDAARAALPSKWDALQQ